MGQKRADEPFAFSARAEFAAAQDGATSRKFSGLAYDGGVIRDHGFWSPLVVDLAGAEFNTPAPALLDHDSPVGVIDAATVNNQIKIGGRLFSGVNAKAKEIADMADAGMPWQMSITARPGSIEEVGKGEKVKANGQTFTGPVTVFRNVRIPEVSFCALGAATGTAAHVFSGAKGGANPGDREMDQAEHDRIVGELNTKLTDATTKLGAATTELGETKTRLTTLEASAKTKATAERTDKVKALFKAIAVEFKDDVAKPYIEMTDEQFVAVEATMKNRAALIPANLLNEQAGGEGAPVDTTDPFALAAAAKAYVFEQAKVGNRVEIYEAVSLIASQGNAAKGGIDTRNAANIGAVRT